jgi:hypothetical protein
MTDEELIDLGTWCEELLSEERFRRVVEEFEQQCFQHFITTTPKDKMERESIYLQCQGAKDFLAHVRAYAEQKDIALKRIEALSQDAQEEDESTDDDGYH